MCVGKNILGRIIPFLAAFKCFFLHGWAGFREPVDDLRLPESEFSFCVFSRDNKARTEGYFELTTVSLTTHIVILCVSLGRHYQNQKPFKDVMYL